jgi:hypothetical protein
MPSQLRPALQRHDDVIVLGFTLPTPATGQPKDQDFLQRFQKPKDKGIREKRTQEPR